MSSALCALWEGFLEEKEAERRRSFFGSPLGGTEGLRIGRSPTIGSPSTILFLPLALGCSSRTRASLALSSCEMG